MPRIFQVPGPLHLEHWLLRAAEIATADPSDYWIGSCRWTAERYLKSGLASHRVFLSHYGTDVGSFQHPERGGLRKMLGVSSTARIVGMVAFIYAPKWYLGISEASRDTRILSTLWRSAWMRNGTRSAFLSAVRLFAEQILCRTRAEELQTEFVVCGHGSLGLSRELANKPGVRVVGFVDNLVSTYLSANVLAVPVPVAGRTHYKLLEAMLLGLPIVASLEGAAVGDMTHGKELLVGDSAESFASAALSIVRDLKLAARLSARGRELIRAHHIWESKAEFLRS